MSSVGTQRSQIRHRLLTGEPFVVKELMGEFGCTGPAIHQVIRLLEEEEGYEFSRSPIKGRVGSPYVFQLKPRTPPKPPTVEERLARLERIVAFHQLGTGLILP